MTQHAQYRDGGNSVYVWTSDKIKGVASTLVIIKDNNKDGIIDSVTISYWNIRKNGKMVTIELNRNSPNEVVKVGPYIKDRWSDDIDEGVEKKPTPSAPVDKSELSRFQMVFDAMKAAEVAFLDSKNVMNATHALKSAAAIHAACAKSSPRDQYLATPTDDTGKIFFDLLKKKYPNISHTMEASAYMNAVCTEFKK